MPGDQSSTVCSLLKITHQKPPRAQVATAELPGLKMLISLKEYPSFFNSNSFPSAWSVFQERILKFSAKEHKLQTGKDNRDSSGREWIVSQLSVFRLFCCLTPILPLCLVTLRPKFLWLNFLIYFPLPAKVGKQYHQVKRRRESGILNVPHREFQSILGFLVFLLLLLCFFLLFVYLCGPFFHCHSEAVTWDSRS